MNTQIVPPSGPLIANMPSGRDIHSTKSFVPPTLDADTLAQMRAPPDRNNTASDGSDSSSDEETRAPGSTHLPGAFPGGSTSTAGESYY